jgi:hypothetical protein
VSITIIETRDEFDQLCVGTVVRSAEGTISARYSRDLGVFFGDERPIPWITLALPVQVLWTPRDAGQVEQ